MISDRAQSPMVISSKIDLMAGPTSCAVVFESYLLMLVLDIVKGMS